MRTAFLCFFFLMCSVLASHLTHTHTHTRFYLRAHWAYILCACVCVRECCLWCFFRRRVVFYLCNISLARCGSASRSFLRSCSLLVVALRLDLFVCSEAAVSGCDVRCRTFKNVKFVSDSGIFKDCIPNDAAMFGGVRNRRLVVCSAKI